MALTAQEKAQVVSQLDKQLAAENKRLALELELLKHQFKQAKPTRQSMVESGNHTSTQSNPHIYRKGSYLQEQLRGQDWAQLADRTQPLPDGIDSGRLLSELGHLYLLKTGYYDDALGEL